MVTGALGRRGFGNVRVSAGVVTPASGWIGPGDARSVGSALRAVVAFGLDDRVRVNAPLRAEAWTRLMETVDGQRLPLLLGAAVEAGVLAVSDQQRADVRGRVADAHRLALSTEGVLTTVVDAFSTAGLAHRILKGHGVSAVCHPTTPVRLSGDVDVFVPRDAFGDAIALLTGMGCVMQPGPPFGPAHRSIAKGATLVHPLGVEIDVHLAITGNSAFHQLATHDVLENPRSVTIAGRTALVPSLETMFVQAAVHLSSRSTRLSSVPDIAWLSRHPEFDPDRARGVAARAHAVGLVRWAVREAGAWVAIAPETVESFATKGSKPDRLSSSIALRAPYLSSLLDLVVVEQHSRYLCEALWPSAAMLEYHGTSRLEYWRHVARGATTLAWSGVHSPDRVAKDGVVTWRDAGSAKTRRGAPGDPIPRQR